MSSAFDTLDYVIGAEQVGIKREHAEYNAKKWSTALELQGNDVATRTFVSSELNVTRSFLSSEMDKLEVRMIKWMIGISLTQVAAILAIVGFVIKH